MSALPGSLRDRIEIQSASEVSDAFGHKVASWSTVATRWGRIEPLSGGELWRTRQVVSSVNCRIVLRFYEGLTPKHRLKKGSRIFELSSALDQGERCRYHVLLAVEQGIEA